MNLSNLNAVLDSWAGLLLSGRKPRNWWLGSPFVAPEVSAPRLAERSSRVGFGQARLYHFRELCKSALSETKFPVSNFAQV